MTKNLSIMYSIVLVFIGFSISNFITVQHDLKSMESLHRKMIKTIDMQNEAIQNESIAIKSINDTLVTITKTLDYMDDTDRLLIKAAKR